ncbi:atherin-like isoform X1 [Cataglyphis hispanica]|uniref:atherin-like isoform X1 n=1 Tax=Cataglyphis hispanica TaxID=1086592 RepID=UPI002180720B|nr:atherin-like isoform X1 [Cataglyphis hispanica]
MPVGRFDLSRALVPLHSIHGHNIGYIAGHCCQIARLGASTVACGWSRNDRGEKIPFASPRPLLPSRSGILSHLAARRCPLLSSSRWLLDPRNRRRLSPSPSAILIRLSLSAARSFCQRRRPPSFRCVSTVGHGCVSLPGRTHGSLPKPRPYVAFLLVPLWTLCTGRQASKQAAKPPAPIAPMPAQSATVAPAAAQPPATTAPTVVQPPAAPAPAQPPAAPAPAPARPPAAPAQQSAE